MGGRAPANLRRAGGTRFVLSAALLRNVAEALEDLKAQCRRPKLTICSQSEPTRRGSCGMQAVLARGGPLLLRKQIAVGALDRVSI